MLNEEVLDSLQKVNVNLVFYGDNITISIQRDKPIDLIYRSAYEYFKLHGKVKLYYKNRELTPFLNYTIGKYFKKLKNIDILVKDSSRMDNMFDNQLLLNSNFNFEQLNKLNSSSNKIQSNKSLINSPNNSSKSVLTQNQRAMTFCWDCKKFPINIFCRDCGAFICKYCRMDLENAHYSHRTITLYPENLAKSANLYKNVLIEDVYEVEKINMNRNKANEEKKEINYYIKNKDKCKQKIINAINDLNQITDEYTNKNDNNTGINEINSNKNVNNNIKDLKEVFGKMNQIEKNTAKICKIGKTIKEWEEINKKLEEALKSVEKRICMIIEETASGEELNYETSNEKNNNDIKNMINNENKEEKEIMKVNEIKNSEKKEEEKKNDNENNKEEKKEQINVGNNEEEEEEEEEEAKS